MKKEEKKTDLGPQGPTFNPRRGDYNGNKITSTVIGKHNPGTNPASKTIPVCSIPMTPEEEAIVGSEIKL